ncbi:hypothetical protein DDZ13_07705 [Coraliomargarita sinensis]|uniref:HTH araC/xylS-type domain-containing protein n=1 Tax=Coraliomargarita sinensis TaxID=2174842 RepID=A0A317ZJK2_9BACT|nr:helix-turn-helix domain-containing protein [Coraliomargarita sinensis]PXA04407.1 hypothetical protein DDZ13_07705 [Coraliomargarita sinensis]
MNRQNYFEYFPAGPHEKLWGLHVSAAGYTRVAPGEPYPSREHPNTRYFTWESGRVLAALQLIFISSGQGTFAETEAEAETTVSEGDVFIVRPGIWHRYKPASQTGWTENWFELRGTSVDRWLAGGLLQKSIYRVSPIETYRQRFDDFHETAVQRPAGYRPTLAGLAMALLGQLSIQNRSSTEINNSIARMVDAAREQLLKGVPVETVAAGQGMSYPCFYRHFKKATGLAPKEYVNKTRHAQAETLLSGSGMSVKEIAIQLGYSSPSHFSADFKKRGGRSPKKWLKD